MTSWEVTISELYQLYMACKKREHQGVSKFIQKLKERNVKFKLVVGEGTTTLHLMCFHGNLGMVKLLVEMYGNAEAKDENQRTPLHLACMQGHLKIAQYLHYECGCILQCEDEDGWMPIELAFFHNQTEIVKYFQIDARGQSPEADLLKLFQGMDQLYQLFTAYKKRDFHLVTESNSHLCVMNVKFVLKSENCRTTLHLMCALGVLDRVKNLIEMYGNVEARDEKGRTPLHIACNNGHIDIAKHLICECGCEKETKDDDQCTPLFAACMGDQISTVKLLISKFSCKVDARDVDGRTPLHVACVSGFQEIVKYLINECGCSPEVRNETTEATPLHDACLGGHLGIVRYLASECKCDTEARDKQNCTPLLYASCSLIASSRSTRNTKTDMVLLQYLILEQDCDPEAESLDGQSPISKFYHYGELNAIKLCIKYKKHDPRTWKFHIRPSPSLNLHNINEKQDSFDHTQSSIFINISPLDIACTQEGSLDVVKFLVEEYGLDPLERDEIIGSDDTAGVVLSVFDHTSILDTVLTEPSADDIKTKVKSDSNFAFIRYPLVQACTSGRLDMLQYLFSKCGLAVSNDYDHRLMCIACNNGYNEIMRFLLKHYTPDFEDEFGNTLLHHAIGGKNVKGAYEIVKVLIANVSNLDQRNHLGDTALHTVCKLQPYRPKIISLLLSSGCNYQISNFAGKTPLWVTQSSEVFMIFMQYSPADVCERILSDDIDEEQSLELLECLIQQYNWNPNDTTKNGDTALHLACKADRLTTVKYLFSMDGFKYDPYAKNKFDQSPIELTSTKEIIRELIKHGNPIDLLINPVIDEVQILQFVREIDNDKLNGTTANDNTALHLACLTDRTTVVKYLLRESKIDVNAKNVRDFSPIQLTKNSEIIIELIRHGANPTNLYSYCRKVLGESKLLQTTVKVFVLGDSNVGKSTLISSLKKEGWFKFNYFTNWLSTATTVAEDAEPDHGIITHDFKSKQCGQITLYDFVGKRFFHENQSDLLRETTHSPRVFIVVTNLSIGVDETISNLQYWLGFLEELSLPDSEFKNHTIIVGSNIDKCRKDEMRKIRSFLQERVSNISSMGYHDFIELDCRSYSSSDFTKLRRCLAKLCVIARNPKSLAFNAHCFQVYIMDRFKGKAAVSVSEILNKMREEEEGVDENDPLNFLPQSDFQLQNLCVELHNKSQILCLRDPIVNEMDFESSWLVIDKAVLISQLFEALESTTFKALPSKNGILSFSIISHLEPIKVYNSEMFIRFLCHLEYCKEISDPETLKAITKSTHANLTHDRSFFFPILVENSAPEGVWDGDVGNFSYHCG